MVLSRRFPNPEAWAQAEVVPQHPQLTASNWQRPQAPGPSLSQVSRVCALEGASREPRVACGRDWVGGQVGSDCAVAPDHSDLLLSVLSPTEISSVTAQAAEPRVSVWGSPRTLGGGGKKEGGLALHRTSWPCPSVGSGVVALPC